jgi:hypothetical protein
MSIKVLGQPSKRKHDNPDLPPIPAAPATDCLTSLEELIAECANHDPTQRLKAAGSHWALSSAANSSTPEYRRSEIVCRAEQERSAAPQTSHRFDRPRLNVAYWHRSAIFRACPKSIVFAMTQISC